MTVNLERRVRVSIIPIKKKKAGEKKQNNEVTNSSTRRVEFAVRVSSRGGSGNSSNVVPDPWLRPLTPLTANGRGGGNKKHSLKRKAGISGDALNDRVDELQPNPLQSRRK